MAGKHLLFSVLGSVLLAVALFRVTAWASPAPEPVDPEHPKVDPGVGALYINICSSEIQCCAPNAGLYRFMPKSSITNNNLLCSLDSTSAQKRTRLAIIEDQYENDCLVKYINYRNP